LKAPLGLCTTAGWKVTKQLLQKYEIDKFFQIIVTREDITLMKPYEEGLRLISHCLKAPVEEMIFIGDSTIDILAAKAMGIKSAYLVGGWEELPPEIKPDYVLNSFSDVLEIK
jgi:phosphoglycolate phosphatase